MSRSKIHLTHEQLLNLEASSQLSENNPGIKFDALLHDPTLMTPEQIQGLISYYRGGQGYSDAAEIAAGNALLLDPTKTRAYWDFTALSGNEDDALTPVSDLTGNGWTLDNATSAFTPKLGYVQSEQTPIAALKALTKSGTKQAMKTTTAATALLAGNVEVHFLIVLVDGQNTGLNYLCGTGNGGTRQFSIRVDANGTLGVEYAANASTLSTLTSTGAALLDGYTGIAFVSVRFDFTNDVISGEINGLPLTFTVASGNALSVWNAANFFSASGFGVGGKVDGTTFTADTANDKYILRGAVTELITAEQRNNVRLAFIYG